LVRPESMFCSRLFSPRLMAFPRCPTAKPPGDRRAGGFPLHASSPLLGVRKSASVMPDTLLRARRAPTARPSISRRPSTAFAGELAHSPTGRSSRPVWRAQRACASMCRQSRETQNRATELYQSSMWVRRPLGRAAAELLAVQSVSISGSHAPRQLRGGITLSAAAQANLTVGYARPHAGPPLHRDQDFLADMPIWSVILNATYGLPCIATTLDTCVNFRRHDWTRSTQRNTEVLAARIHGWRGTAPKL